MQEELFQSPAVIIASAGSNKYVWQAIIGERVQHKTYGSGTILGIEFLDKPFGVRISVNFDIEGTYIHVLGYIAVTENIMTFLNPSLNILEKARQIEINSNNELKDAKNHNDDKNQRRKSIIESYKILNIEQHIKLEFEQRAQQIKQLCAERKLINLVHFTPIKNLHSILEKGLLGKNDLSKLPIQHQPKWNDDLRLDGHPEAVCLTITFPNYQMFYKYSRNNRHEWVVLLIDAAILWDLECAFCQDNAASTDVKNKRLVDKKRVSEMRKMFDDFNEIDREELSIPKNYPTNPQAEVLALEPIAPSNIKEVHFYNKEALQKWRDENSVIYQQKLVINQQFFKPRNDWSKWSLTQTDNYFEEDFPF